MASAQFVSGSGRIVGLLVLIVAGVGIFVASFDPDSYKPRIVAAVKQATGRDLTLKGHIHLGLSLQPTLTVQDVSFANPPGFSRPQMATLEQLDLQLALFPLLSHQRRDQPAGAGEARHPSGDQREGPIELAVHPGVPAVDARAARRRGTRREDPPASMSRSSRSRTAP